MGGRAVGTRRRKLVRKQMTQGGTNWKEIASLSTAKTHKSREGQASVSGET